MSAETPSRQSNPERSKFGLEYNDVTDRIYQQRSGINIVLCLEPQPFKLQRSYGVFDQTFSINRQIVAVGDSLTQRTVGIGDQIRISEDSGYFKEGDCFRIEGMRESANQGLQVLITSNNGQDGSSFEWISWRIESWGPS